jgi:hypothetical protein
MPDQANLDLVELEKRIIQLEHMLRIFDAYIASAEASYLALKNLVLASNNVTDSEITILLRAIVRLRGLAPIHPTKKHLIKALLEDEYGVKLHFRKKTAQEPVPPR